MNITVDQLEEASTLAPATTIRLGDTTDEKALARLSDLEDAEAGSAPHVVAEQDGEVVASLSLRDDVALGDPFRPTANLIALLRAYATHVAPTRQSERRFARRLAALTSAAVAAGAIIVSSAVAATTVSIAGTPVKIHSQTKTFAISVSCASESDPCEGVLDVKTAGKVKPYRSIAAAVARVGTFPFSIAPGTTALVKGRVYGPALAEALLRGKVRLSLTPRAISGPLGPEKTVVFTHRRR